ncbi:sensor histidine kinase [Arthrobacter oryzae]|uniref:sensor histidine kinase n=1 Tax=Arthrobacter oryzae TaxID=409290 RepID=UPI00273A9B3E|nr:sensor histidine kinase [Arthrobacter oryzae]WLQ06870.1 HAMP domain-containing sensor histidine kinase [Arthrobacter oryzae]
MTDRLLQIGTKRYFGRLGTRAQVALCQLPLTLIVTALTVATPFAWPALLHSPLYIAGAVLHVGLFMACFLVPWERLRPSAYLIIPVLDLLALWLSRNGAGPILPGLGVLAIFPVIWLSASGMLARTGVTLSFVGPLLIMLPTLIGKLPNPSASDITSVILLPVMMLAVSLSIRFASVNMRLQQRQLQEKDRELRELLRQSRDREGLLKTILGAVDVGIVAVNPTGQGLLTNNWQLSLQQGAAYRNPHAKLEEKDQLIFARDRITPLAPERRPIRRALDGESFADYLVWFGEGEAQRAVSTAAKSLENENGDFTGAVIVYNDVTGLVEALAANEELVSNVSHEFRTPLNSILGNVDLVLDDLQEISPISVQRLEVVQRNSERLLALVSDLSLSASSALKVHPKRTDLAGLVETTIGSALAHADRANISLVKDVPSPLWAYADPLRIGQALDNLVSNAIKYSPDGGVVSISAQRTAEWVKLSVKDTGMGMSADDSAKIFRRFFRAKPARDAAIPGAGLGLSITKTIVERHGGTISCSSEPGRGSTFTVALPSGDELLGSPA